MIKKKEVKCSPILIVLRMISCAFLWAVCTDVLAFDEGTHMAVWANEAIVSTYTYDYKNFLERQKQIANYFTANGWINYTKALTDAKLLETVKKNSYAVSAVATMPPVIKQIKNDQWQAIMSLLVIYKNESNQQKQTLRITLNFIKAAVGTGVNGFAITDLVATVEQPPCQCASTEKYKAVV